MTMLRILVIMTLIVHQALQAAVPGGEAVRSGDIIQLDNHTLQLSYFPRPDVTATRVQAVAKQVSLPIQTEAYPYAEATTAVLFLVDTSDPRRQATIKTNIRHIKRLVQNAKPHHRFGLADFSSKLKMLVPLGASSAEIAAAAEKLEADGRTTELYMHTLSSINRLIEFPAKRKVLFLFSDGLAEDREPESFHQNVVSVALQNNIVIYTLGYPNHKASTAGFEILQRLATETGGRFIATDNGRELPADLLQSPFAALDTGGRLTLDLTPLLDKKHYGEQTVRVVWYAGTESVQSKEIKVRLMEPPLPEPLPAPLPPPAETPLWWWAVMAGMMLIIIGGGAYLYWQRYGPKTVYAYFDYMNTDGEWVTHEMISSTMRIGRHQDNELRLDDPWVSSHHAEIHLQRDGTFMLSDLQSTNGVLLNGKTTKSAELFPGDEVEIGKIKLRFNKSQP